MTTKPRNPPRPLPTDASHTTPLQAEIERLQAWVNEVAARLDDDLSLDDLLRATRVLSVATLQLARLLVIQRDLGGSAEDAEMAEFDAALEEVMRRIQNGQMPS